MVVDKVHFKDKIISKYANKACKKIAVSLIRRLQQMTGEKMSGDGSPLKNIWDEVCIQVQYEYSFYWDYYLLDMENYMSGEIEDLDRETKEAIWKQTRAGMEWEAENEDEEDLVYGEDDIIEYVLNEFVLSEAMNYTNKRIQKYVDYHIYGG